jgi:hypothetical protein
MSASRSDLLLTTGELAGALLSTAAQLKVYHWQTPSFARHKASDALVTSLTDKMDKLVEVLQGAVGGRLLLPRAGLTIKVINMRDDEAMEYLEDVRQNVLLSRNMFQLCQMYSDVANIRDELLAEIHQAQYLFTFQ